MSTTPVDPNSVSLFRDSHLIPEHYWEDLITLNPSEVVRRGLLPFPFRETYEIPFLNQIYLCRPSDRRIWRKDRPEKEIHFQEYLVLLMYLTRVKDIPLEGKKINEREIPGGELFFKGPHALLKAPLEKKFSRDPQGFVQSGMDLGGIKTEKGDASFELPVLPRIPVEYILYLADDEFPAELLILFDATIHRHLPLDVIWAMINITSRRLSGK